MKTNYKEIEKCCGNCQFVTDSPFSMTLKCGHCDNVRYDRMLKSYFMKEVAANGICDRYTKPYTLKEADFNKIVNKTKEKLIKSKI